MILLIIIMTVCFAVLEAYFDSQKIKKDIPIKHSLSMIPRLLGLGLLIVLVIWLNENFVLLGAIASITYWIVFDSFINIFLHRPLFQMGKTSIIDRLFRSIGADERGFIAFKMMI